MPPSSSVLRGRVQCADALGVLERDGAQPQLLVAQKLGQARLRQRRAVRPRRVAPQLPRGGPLAAGMPSCTLAMLRARVCGQARRHAWSRCQCAAAAVQTPAAAKHCHCQRAAQAQRRPRAAAPLGQRDCAAARQHGRARSPARQRQQQRPWPWHGRQRRCRRCRAPQLATFTRRTRPQSGSCSAQLWHASCTWVDPKLGTAGAARSIAYCETDATPPPGTYAYASGPLLTSLQ